MLIRLIGPVEVEMDGVAHPFKAPKSACVLAALADRLGEPVDLPTLMTCLWGDEPPDTAVSIIYSYMARLRAILRKSDAVTLGRAGRLGYVLQTDPDNVDVHTVRNLARRATAEVERGNLHSALPLWRKAAELARGEALVGIGGEWAARYRDRFRTERRQLLASRYDTELKLGHHNLVVDDLVQLVAREPLTEPFVEHLMLALYRCGRAAEALDQYEATRIGLRERLGADASPRLKALHRRILKQDPTLAVQSAVTVTTKRSISTRSVPAQLPPDPTAFIGRDGEMAAILAKRAERPVIVIDGMAGIGKTALAVHAGHRLAPEYPDGQLFVDLRGYAEAVSPLDAEDALEQMLRALEVEVPETGGMRSAALRTALSGRRVLLVLDNARDAGQVLPLLPGSTECLTIVTSRRRMVDLVEARSVSLEALSPADAAEVFVTEADRAPADDSVIEQITAACAHLPLALRIAASRLRNRPTWTFGDLLRRLSDDRTGPRSLGASVHDGVAAAFDLSYFDLSEEERAFFRALGVFPGSSFDTLVAAVLADVAPLDADGILERLVDAHLVIPTGSGLYRLHDLLRGYASALVEPPEHDAAWRRLVDLYVLRARVAAELVHPNFDAAQPPDMSGTGFSDAGDARRWFHDEVSTIVSIVDREIELENHSAVADLCAPTTIYLMHHELNALRLSLAHKGAAASRTLGNPARVSRFENQYALACNKLGRLDEALDHFEKALLLDAADHAYVSHITINIGATYFDRGESRKAAEQYRSAARIAAQHDFASGEALALCNLGEALTQLGAYEEAVAALDRSESIVRKQGNRLELMRTQYNRAQIDLAVGDHTKAAERFDRVLDYCREHNETVGELSALSGLADVANATGDYERATDLALQQLDLVADVPQPANEIEALTQLGRAQAGAGETGDATESLRAAVSLARKLGMDRLRAQAEHALGEHLARYGDRTEAVDRLTRAHEFYLRDGYPQTETLRRRLAELSSHA